MFERGFLYKYKPLSDKSFGHVCEVIRDSKIFFPRPSQLNDPAECKPTTTIGDITDPQYRPAVEAWVRRCVAHRVQPPSEAQIQQELAELTQEKLLWMLKQVDIEYRAAVESRYCVLSLADSPVNSHLWDAYADRFGGVCLQFAVDSRFGTAYQVQYIDGDRTLDLTSADDYEHLVQTGLVKRRKWRHEREFRLIFGEPPVEDQPPLIHQRYEFPPAHLTALIIGHRVTIEHPAKLVALPRYRQPRLRCFQAFPARRVR